MSRFQRLAAASLTLLLAACAGDVQERLTAPDGIRAHHVAYVHMYCSPYSLTVGQSGSCWADAYDTNGSPVYHNQLWSSSNSSVLQVGLYGSTYGASPGTAFVYVNIDGYQAWTTVEVQAPPQPLPPLTVTIDGPTSITRVGTYTWVGYATNKQSSESVTYKWEASTNGGGSWTQVGTSQYYSRTLASGDPSFQLRLTVTSSINRSPASTSTTASVSVSNPLLPSALYVSVSGPDYIMSAGTYSWTAHPTGGVSPYSYVWEKSTDGGSTWSTLLSTQYSYPIYSQTATMNISCGSGTLRYRAKVTSSDGQVQYGYRTSHVYC
jgi:hypothetical protein